MALPARKLCLVTSLFLIVLLLGCADTVHIRRYPQGGVGSHDGPSAENSSADTLAVPTSTPSTGPAKRTPTPRLIARHKDGRLRQLPVSEPSGVAYHPQRDSLLVVSDGGDLFELDMGFNVLQRIKLRGDLEGVSVHPTEETVYVASESAATVYEYGLDSRRVLRAFVVDMYSHADFPLGGIRNKGLEGVAAAQIAPNDVRLMAVVEGEPARLVQLSADISPRAVRAARALAKGDSMSGAKRETTTIVHTYDLGLKRLSDVTYCPSSRTFIVISANDKIMRSCDLDGQILGSVKIPGRKPEGLCLLPGGEVLVVQDSGGVYRSDTVLRDLKASE